MAVSDGPDVFDRTEVGRMAEEIVATGGLLPDDIMLKVVTSKLDLLHNKVSISTSPYWSYLIQMRDVALDFGWVPPNFGPGKASG